MINMTYREFIDNILNTRGRFGCGNQYHERHHIIPKCLGGTGEKDNLIDLFAKEHFIAHKLLAEENPTNMKLIHAYSAMAFMCNDSEQRYELTPEEYENARLVLSNGLKEKYKDKTKHPSYGTHISEERKKHISEVNKGNKYCVGRIVSEETRRKISEANKNPSAETRLRMSLSRKGKNLRGANSNAKPVIRLSDKKVYECMKDAAEDNNIDYKVFQTMVKRHNGFMKYNEYLELEK